MGEKDCLAQVVTKRYRLYWLTNSALVYGVGGRGSGVSAKMRRFSLYIFSLQSEKNPHFSLIFALSEYERRTLVSANEYSYAHGALNKLWRSDSIFNLRSSWSSDIWDRGFPGA